MAGKQNEDIVDWLRRIKKSSPWSFAAQIAGEAVAEIERLRGDVHRRASGGGGSVELGGGEEMRIVWKYELTMADVQLVNLPEGAEILTVQDQRGRLTLWAMVDPDEKRISPVRIEILPTGVPVQPASRKHLATVQQENGHLLWHVFQRVGPS